MTLIFLRKEFLMNIKVQVSIPLVWLVIALVGCAPIPMRKPPTGEPCAGEPHARFGGRGGSFSLSDPYLAIFLGGGATIQL